MLINLDANINLFQLLGISSTDFFCRFVVLQYFCYDEKQTRS